MKETAKFIISKEKKDEHNYSVIVRFRKDFIGFQGHFPKHPILPAVFHIDLCVEALNNIFNKEYEIKEIKTSKFSAMVEPETKIELQINIKELKEESITAKIKIFLPDGSIASTMSITIA